MATDQSNIPNEGSDSLLALTRTLVTSADPVTIATQEYEQLLQLKREYSALRKALLFGGIDSTTLHILVSTNLPPLSPNSSSKGLASSPEHRKASPTDSVPRGSCIENSDRLDSTESSPSAQRCEYSEPAQPLTPDSDTQGDHEVTDMAEPCEEKQPKYETNYEDRSLLFRGLAPCTTLRDVTKAIRGGALLNIYITPKDKVAHVSFVDHNAAEQFILYVRRNDFYVRGKRLTVCWDERQSYLPGYIAHRIACNGASRNLVICRPKPDMTEDAIRKDLEHIHQLQVVDIAHENGHIFVSTNSVRHAITARTCMLSRIKYRNARIEFYPDECDQLFPAPSPQQYCRKSLPARVHQIRYRNRFDLLRSQSEDDLQGIHEFKADVQSPGW